MGRETAKFGRFVEALERLCREHEVQLCASEYDHLQVWDLDGGGRPVDRDRIEDRTKQEVDG